MTCCVTRRVAANRRLLIYLTDYHSDRKSIVFLSFYVLCSPVAIFESEPWSLQGASLRVTASYVVSTVYFWKVHSDGH